MALDDNTMNLSIKMDSSAFNKAMDNISKDMQGVAKTAASMSAKIQQIVFSISGIINNELKKTNDNQQKLSEQEIKIQEAKFAHIKSEFYKYNADQKKKAITDERDFIDTQLSYYTEETEKRYQLLKQREEKEKELRDLGNFDMIDGFSNALKEIENSAINFNEIFSGIFKGLTSSISGELQQMLTDMEFSWQKLGESVGKIAETMKKAVIKVISDMVAEWIVQQGIILIKEKALAVARIAIDAAVGGAKTIAQLGWWGIPLGLATMAAVMAFAGVFEQGGIISGVSYSGDNLIARVNSGEMILNKQQQANLWNLANGSGILSNGNTPITINQNIEVNSNGGDISSLTQAIRRGTLEALEFAGLTYNIGAKQSGVAL
jgi:hypothetical protein